MTEEQARHAYGAAQISTLEGLAAVRKRPGMYIGSTGPKGVTHLLFEAVDNAVDEFMVGHGTVVHVTVRRDGTVVVQDEGRGIPVGTHPTERDVDGAPLDALTLAFTRLHAGGKFGTADSAYKNPGGLHGIGLKAINALSDLLVVQVRRDGQVHEQRFQRGQPLGPVQVVGSYAEGPTGTCVTWHPDPEIFHTTQLPECRALQARFDEFAALNAGLTLHYHNEDTQVSTTYYSAAGLKAYPARLLNERKTLYDEPLYLKGRHGAIDVEVAWVHVDQEKPYELIKAFANNINTTEGGYHLQGFRRGYDELLSRFILEKNLSKEKVELGYLLDGIIAVVSVKLPEAEFEGQTKSKLGNEEAKTAVEAVFAQCASQLLGQKSSQAALLTIAQHALNVKEAEDAARKARALARQGNKVKKMALPGKLADCASRNGYSELILCEGLSAAGSLKMARNKDYQAVLPLRGKVLNIEKVDLNRLLESEAIANIIAALGTGVGKQFNIKLLRYDKIIFVTDSDIDGRHIQMLLMTLFYRYLNPLIEAGRVYIGQPPLYRVRYKREITYLHDDHALKQWVSKHVGKDYEVQRFKGLGEMNPEQLFETTIDPARRTLLQLTTADAEAASQAIVRLMGPDPQLRRDFIESNAHLVDLGFFV